MNVPGQNSETLHLFNKEQTVLTKELEKDT